MGKSGSFEAIFAYFNESRSNKLKSISYGDMYGGWYYDNRPYSEACYCMNDKDTKTYLYDSYNSNVYCNFVNASDVYVAGYYDNELINLVCYWMNNN